MNNFFKLESILFNLFQYVKIFLSDLLMFCLNVHFDISIVVFIKRSQRHSVHHSKLKKTSRSRITSMIVLNGLNFLFLRFPSDLVDFYGLIFTYEITHSFVNYKPYLSSYLICRIFRQNEFLVQNFSLVQFIFSICIEFNCKNSK